MRYEEISAKPMVYPKGNAVSISTEIKSEKNVNIDFSQAKVIGTYEQNNNGNSFLREYLYGKAKQQGRTITQLYSMFPYKGSYCLK